MKKIIGMLMVVGMVSVSMMASAKPGKVAEDSLCSCITTCYGGSCITTCTGSC